MFNSFKKLRRFATIRKLSLFIFKIIAVILSFIFLAIIALIIQLSVKPRSIEPINKYIIKKINTNPNFNIEFKPSDATLKLNIGLELQYNIKNVKITFFNNELSLADLSVDIDFTKLILGKILIKSIVLQNTSFEIDLKKLEKKEKKPFIYKELVSYYQSVLKNILSSSIVIDKFILKDFNIIMDFSNNKKSLINIISSRFDIDLKDDNFSVNQNTLFSINKNKIKTKIKTNCKNEDSSRKCLISFENINPNDYFNYFSKNSNFYDYLYNMSGYFNGNINFILNDNLEFDTGNITLTSPIGSFYLKQFFDERISFSTLIVKADFKDNFNILNLNSVNASFGDTNFFMSMFFKEEENYKNLDLNFDIKNIQLINLKRLWPNFLGQEEGVRPWVLEHIKGGISPRATAKMNLKYFKDEKNDNSGLQSIYSEVQMDKVLLNYDDYFPEVKNIDGLAVFTIKDMLINITNGDVLRSKINNGSISIDFTKKNKNIVIKSNTKGPISDLFIHINKSDANLIKNSVNGVVEDYYTNSKINLIIPIIDDINFYNTGINISSNILNKKNSLLINSTNIPLSFIKRRKTNIFYGNIDLTKSDLQYIPLNIYKDKNKELSFNYKCDFHNGTVYIKEFKPSSNYIGFALNGFIDLPNKTEEINITNINYNSSKYNLFFKSYAIKDKIYSDIGISGININYNNIIEKIKKLNFVKQKDNVNNETNVNLKLQSFNFGNNKQLSNPTLYAKFEGNKLIILDFTANMTKKKDVKLSLNKRKNMFNIKSNDFGLLFNTIQLTDKILNGNGEINLKQEIQGKKNILVGNLKIDKKFSIIPDNEVKEDVLLDVGEDKDFKDLKKGLKNDNITFDKLKGEFYYTDNILDFKEVVAKSKFLSFQILASGFINIKTEQMEIQGLLVPLGFINGLFGINKLPLISDIIFGQKNAGLFASKFEVIRLDKNSKVDIKINKFSMILPGFLRNVFDRNTYK